MTTGIPHDVESVLEDLAFLDSTGVGATEAASRTGFASAEALEKWLTRQGHYSLWQKFKHREAPGIHHYPTQRKRRARAQTRVCTGCETEKPLTDFYQQTTGPGGYMSQCIRCNNDRPPTVSRIIRNRARSRTYSILAERHRAEFEQLLAEQVEVARAEHERLAAAAASAGQHDAPVARLRPGMKRDGETVTDRLDVARCPSCHTHHDAGHECPSCGDTTPAAAPRVKPWQVRAWATEQGLQVPIRGPIPETVQTAYDDAHREVAS